MAEIVPTNFDFVDHVAHETADPCPSVGLQERGESKVQDSVGLKVRTRKESRKTDTQTRTHTHTLMWSD